jgi:hypothetical protein
MRCLNRQRANIVFSNMFQHATILCPSDVAQRERIFERDGALRWADDTVIGYCRIGVPLDLLLSRMGQRNKRSGSLHMHAVKLPELMDVFADEQYILWFADNAYEALIVLKEGCTPIDQLKAWGHALLLAQVVRGQDGGHQLESDDASSGQKSLAELRETLEQTRDMWEEYANVLEQEGWDLGVAALETRAGSRVQIETRKEK